VGNPQLKLSHINNYEYFLVAVVIAGFIQVLLGFLKAGVIGNFFPTSVIKGMLSAIGILLILKQIPHAVGYDNDVEGDEEFIQSDGHNTFTEFFDLSDNITLGCIIISVITASILLLWETKFISKSKLRTIPAALIAVLAGTLVSYLMNYFRHDAALEQKHLVNLPVSNNIYQFADNFTIPDFVGGFKMAAVWTAGITIAIVASLESLLSIEATDKLDPQKRLTPLNRELYAQGFGNIVSGVAWRANYFPRYWSRNIFDYFCRNRFRSSWGSFANARAWKNWRNQYLVYFYAPFDDYGCCFVYYLYGKSSKKNPNSIPKASDGRKDVWWRVVTFAS
jgi:MFS superfamily sulfate permease-like transporter